MLKDLVKGGENKNQNTDSHQMMHADGNVKPNEEENHEIEESKKYGGNECQSDYGSVKLLSSLVTIESRIKSDRRHRQPADHGHEYSDDAENQYILPVFFG